MEKSIDLVQLKQAIDYLESKPVVQCTPYPEYEKYVFDVLYSLGIDDEYITKYDSLNVEEIDKMSLDDIKVMYTFICRGERFSLGFIASNIEDGTILTLAKREYELLNEKAKH